MSLEIITNADAARRVVRHILISLVVAVGMTFLAMAIVFGLDPDATVRVGKVLTFGLLAPTILSLVVCPCLCYPTVIAIRDRNRAQRELQRLSATDQLTDLLNRRGFQNAAEEALETASGTGLAVMIIDVDHFKAVNDEFGHDFGDAALVHVAGILRNMGQEKNFIVGRQGGEEFIALLTGTTEPAAMSIADHVRVACAQHPVVHDGRSAFITISIGVASIGGAANAGSPVFLPGLAARADAALYLAKRNGRNRVHLAEPVMPIASAA